MKGANLYCHKWKHFVFCEFVRHMYLFARVSLRMYVFPNIEDEVSISDKSAFYEVFWSLTFRLIFFFVVLWLTFFKFDPDLFPVYQDF